MAINKRDLKYLSNWLKSIIITLDSELDENVKKRITENCGKSCAYVEDMKIIKGIIKNYTEIDQILQAMNKEKIWCGPWIREGDVIYSICTECGCPLVKASFIKASATFCNCSTGWIKEVFSHIIQNPIEVEIKEAIGRGDKRCLFLVRITRQKNN